MEELMKDIERAKAKSWNDITVEINVIEGILKELEYYKERYLEFNNFFIHNNYNTEAMLNELKQRYKVYRETGGKDND